MRRFALLGLLIAACLIAVACGGGHHTTVTRTVNHTSTTTTTAAAAPATGTVPGQCTPLDTTMDCVLANQPPAPRAFSVSPGQQYGIDFGWSSVSAATAKSVGAKFGASYLSDDPTKNWTVSLVNAYHADGLKTVAVWETSATRAEWTTPADGAADAHAALAEAEALGMPSNRVIEFAVDCDCTGASITSYFQGVHSVLGARAGIYGGYSQVGAMHAAGLVGNENWQTYAWSGGLWQPASIAPLEQYLNGSTYDNDRALAPLYGQWPAQVTPAENPHHYSWLPNTKRTFKVTDGKRSRTVHARERSAIQTWDKQGCRNPVHRQVCREHRTHMQLLGGRISHIAHHTPNLKHGVKHPRWGAQHFKATDGHKTTLGGAYQQFARRESLKNHGVVKGW